MHSQLKQILFLAIFGLICCVFVFFVPWGESVPESSLPLQNTDFSSGSNQDQEVNSGVEVFTGSLQVAVDSKLLTDQVGVFLEQIATGLNIPLDVIAFDGSGGSIQAYDLVFSSFDPEAEAKKVNFSVDITPFFLTGLANMLEKRDFFPYALDPLVAMIGGDRREWIDLQTDFLADEWRGNMRSYLLGPHNHPDLSAQNLAFYLMLKDFIQFNDVGAFDLWLQMLLPVNLREKRITSLANMQVCKDRLTACLLEKKMITVGFGFASEVADEPHMTIQPYPYAYQGLPARLYGFWIPQTSKHPLQAEQFLLSALQIPVEQGSKMIDQMGMVAALVDLYSQQSQVIPRSTDQRKILFGESQMLDSLFADPLLLKVQEKKLKPDLYLDSTLL